MPCGRSSRASSIMSAAPQAAGKAGPEIDDPKVVTRRPRGAAADVGRVRHHRMRQKEPLLVVVFGEQQVDAALRDPLSGTDGCGERPPQRPGNPALDRDRGSGVLVHVPDRGRAAQHGQHQQQLGSWMTSRWAFAAWSASARRAASNARSLRRPVARGTSATVSARPGRHPAMPEWRDICDVIAGVSRARIWRCRIRASAGLWTTVHTTTRIWNSRTFAGPRCTDTKISIDENGRCHRLFRQC